jgi:hypothetical protein
MPAILSRTAGERSRPAQLGKLQEAHPGNRTPGTGGGGGARPAAGEQQPAIPAAGPLVATALTGGISVRARAAFPAAVIQAERDARLRLLAAAFPAGL